MNTERYVLGFILIASGGRTWVLSVQYTSSVLDGWALSIAGLACIAYGVHALSTKKVAAWWSDSCLWSDCGHWHCLHTSSGCRVKGCPCPGFLYRGSPYRGRS